MNDIPYMPLYIADYMGDTLHLSTEQHGAYLLLLMTMWRAGGTLPNDPAKLSRIARMTVGKWSRVGPDVMAFFQIDGENITHGRLVFELTKAQEISAKRSELGKQGGAAKAMKYKKTGLAIATPTAQATAPARQWPGSAISGSGIERENNTPIAEHNETAALHVRVHDRCCEAIGVDPAKDPAWVTTGDIQSWIASGADPENDILPAIRDTMAKRRASDPEWKPGSMRYFRNAVSEWKNNRERGLPPPAGAPPTAAAMDAASLQARLDQIKGAA